jgi:diamine N-acetyltransferase
MIPLEGKNIKLRAMEPSDLDVLYLWENDPENWFVSNTYAPFSKHILMKFIEEAGRDIFETRQMRLIIILKSQIEGKDIPVGAIDLFDFDPHHLRAGLGILIGRKDLRNQGIASEALSIFIDYAFNVLQLHQLYCNIAVNNKTSLNLFKKHGFIITGEKTEWLKNAGSWLNEYLLQLINPNK